MKFFIAISVIIFIAGVMCELITRKGGEENEIKNQKNINNSNNNNVNSNTQ